MKYLIVIPTYNESETLPSLLSAIFSDPELVDTHILVVDDNSPDNTGELVRRLIDNKTYGDRLYLLQRKGKLGLGTAYISGFKWGLNKSYDVLVEMDADHSHDPEYLAPIFEQLKDVDFVVGSRYVDGGGVENWGIGRQLLSRFGSYYARTILRLPIRDLTGGFNFWKKKVLEEIDLDSIQSNGYAFQIELKYRASKRGFSYQEYPIVFVDRRMGVSKMSKKIIFEAMYRVWKIR